MKIFKWYRYKIGVVHWVSDLPMYIREPLFLPRPISEELRDEIILEVFEEYKQIPCTGVHFEETIIYSRKKNLP